ncbi:MAG: ATP-binding protein [Nocardioidaceae bacterium]|nr:ATP-binding protein [Nocardioidaceae bacterium]
MPWRQQTLALIPSAPSVRRARDWVGTVLEEMGRPELVDSARLGVSELVTNALLHAEPPLAVRLRGTTEHPRVEVSDQSLRPPMPRPRAAVALDDELTWTTTGRGLDLVGCHAVAWGADIDPRGIGKVVWFEPRHEPRDEPVEGALFDMDQALMAYGGELADPGELVRVDLVGFPVQLFAHLRLMFHELARELRLLAVIEPGNHPLAEEYATLFVQVEHERRQVRGLEVLEKATAAGFETVDLHYRVPPTAPATMARVADVLRRIALGFDQTLISVKPSGELRALQDWYLGEFVRQGAGEAATPWTGPARLDRRRDVS